MFWIPWCSRKRTIHLGKKKQPGNFVSSLVVHMTYSDYGTKMVQTEARSRMDANYDSGKHWGSGVLTKAKSTGDKMARK